METEILTKKGLKNFINENGFFSKMEFCSAEAPENLKIPKGAKYFKGIASNGELNRNGYIIEEDAWNGSIDTFMANPVVLLQHEQKNPIGNAISAKVTSNGLEVEGYIFPNMMDEKSVLAFENGILKGLSTGHITKHAKFKNEKTGRVIQEEEIGLEGNPSWFDVIFSNAWTMIVDALDWVEFSLVTIPANAKSMITETNAIGSEDAKTKYAIKKNKLSLEEIEAKKLHLVEEDENSSVTDLPDEEGEIIETIEEPETVEEEGENPEVVVVEAENAETDEPEQEEEEPETVENSLRDMTKALAQNLLKLETEVNQAKAEVVKTDAIKILENSIAEQKEAIASQNEVIIKMVNTINVLSNSLNGINERMNKVAVNKPLIVHQQLRKAEEPKKRSWA